MLGDRARWSVIWWQEKKGKLIEVEFDHDFNSALELYIKVKTEGKKLATLRSCNVGFPPPEKYLPQEMERESTRTVFEKKPIYGKKGKKIKGYREVEVQEPYIEKYVYDPMVEINLKDILWCPYCRELRKFRQQNGFQLDGKFVPIPGNFCPICGISIENHNVRKWNPALRRVVSSEDIRVSSDARPTTSVNSPRRSAGKSGARQLTDAQRQAKRERARKRAAARRAKG